MTQKQNILRADASPMPALLGIFEGVLRRVANSPTSCGQTKTITMFVQSLLEGEAFNLFEIENLVLETDRNLCEMLLEFCLTVGLSEDERQTASLAFTPFFQLHSPGTRH